MSVSISNWFNNPSFKPAKGPASPCETKKGDCLKVIQFIIDGEATFEEQKHFELHILECLPCFEQYHLDKSIKAALQNKISKRELPSGLVEEIKSRINRLS